LTVGEIPLAALDFESAGSAPGMTDEPVQIAVAHWNHGSIEIVLDSHIRPSRPVTWAAQRVHGIGDEELRAAPALLDLWPRVKAALAGRWIAAHGASTEKRFLRAFPLHGFGPWIDTLALARALYPGIPSHALGDTIAALGLSEKITLPGFRWHDAASDAFATLVLLRHLIEQADISDEPAETLTRPNLTAYFKSRRK
jgi:DNA polymerase-3 subunit epsilon